MPWRNFTLTASAAVIAAAVTVTVPLAIAGAFRDGHLASEVSSLRDQLTVDQAQVQMLHQDIHALVLQVRALRRRNRELVVVVRVQSGRLRVLSHAVRGLASSLRSQGVAAPIIRTVIRQIHRREVIIRRRSPPANPGVCRRRLPNGRCFPGRR